MGKKNRRASKGKGGNHLCTLGVERRGPRNGEGRRYLEAAKWTTKSTTPNNGASTPKTQKRVRGGISSY